MKYYAMEMQFAMSAGIDEREFYIKIILTGESVARVRFNFFLLLFFFFPCDLSQRKNNLFLRMVKRSSQRDKLSFALSLV